MINNKIRNQYSNNSERQWMASIRDMEEHPSPMTDAFLRPAYDRTVACAIPERRPKQTLAIKDRHKLILDYINSYIQQHGYPPCFREIANGTGFKSPASINSNLKEMRKLGLIDYIDGYPRTITIVVNTNLAEEGNEKISGKR